MCAQVGEIYADLDLANLSAGDLISLKPFAKFLETLSKSCFGVSRASLGTP